MSTLDAVYELHAAMGALDAHAKLMKELTESVGPGIMSAAIVELNETMKNMVEVRQAMVALTLKISKENE